MSVTTADFDSNEFADIATANFNTDSVSVLLNTPNVPPVAVDDTYDANEDVKLDIAAQAGVLGNDTDPNSDPLTAGVVDNVQHGTLTLNLNARLTTRLTPTSTAPIPSPTRQTTAAWTPTPRR